MDPAEYVKSRQKIWASLRNIQLIGSQNDRGERIYAKTLDENLFQPISPDTKTSFENGDGNELSNGVIPGKMQALHSSSALAVNVFDYWVKTNDKSSIAKSLLVPSGKIARVTFEKKYKIFDETEIKSPNIDVVIEYNDEICCAIECKFTEPFGNRQADHGLKQRYLDDFKAWDTIPEIYKLATSISPEDETFQVLHAAQLIKHILGLLKHYKNQKEKFRFIYLYYAVSGEEGYIHEKEIAQFGEIAKKDGIIFQAITWQNLIFNLFKNCSNTHDKYLRYLFERYI
jgi:hypothetical protein